MLGRINNRFRVCVKAFMQDEFNSWQKNRSKEGYAINIFTPVYFGLDVHYSLMSKFDYEYWVKSYAFREHRSAKFTVCTVHTYGGTTIQTEASDMIDSNDEMRLAAAAATSPTVPRGMSPLSRLVLSSAGSLDSPVKRLPKCIHKTFSYNSAINEFQLMKSGHFQYLAISRIWLNGRGPFCGISSTASDIMKETTANGYIFVFKLVPPQVSNNTDAVTLTFCWTHACKETPVTDIEHAIQACNKRYIMKTLSILDHITKPKYPRNQFMIVAAFRFTNDIISDWLDGDIWSPRFSRAHNILTQNAPIVK